MPLVYSEWGNSDGDPNGEVKNYTEMTKKYLEWWDDNNILNCAWMLCHGDYTYSLWNTNLGDKSEFLKYGCISDEYLSEYGKVVFQSYFDNNIKRVKNNEKYINRDLNQETKEDENTNNNINQNNSIENNNNTENTNNVSKTDNTIKKGQLPKAGQKAFYLYFVTMIILIINIIVYIIKRNSILK